MTIYQVLDEQNHPVFEAKSFLQAQKEAELLNQSSDDHFFFVETATKIEAKTHQNGQLSKSRLYLSH